METLVNIIFLICVFLLARYFLEKDKYKKLEKQDFNILKNRILAMGPREFEIFSAKLFELYGYKAYVTKSTGDGGKDIILQNKFGKAYVECKHFINGSVGRPIAQKLMGAMVADNVNQGIIITTGTFTQQCIQYCRKLNILTYDMNDILEIAGNIGTTQVLRIAGIERESWDDGPAVHKELQLGKTKNNRKQEMRQARRIWIKILNKSFK